MNHGANTGFVLGCSFAVLVVVLAFDTVTRGRPSTCCQPSSTTRVGIVDVAAARATTRRVTRFRTRLSLAVASLLAVVGNLSAVAFWTTSGGGGASPGVATLNPPARVVVPSNSTGSVSVSWAASTTSGGGVVPTGYYVQRFRARPPALPAQRLRPHRPLRPLAPRMASRVGPTPTRSPPSSIPGRQPAATADRSRSTPQPPSSR
jgi:hypothetical protein